MDEYVIDYIRSGKAFLLIGSGPSIAMGYPTWGKLAEIAVDLVRNEMPAEKSKDIQKAQKRNDYTMVFEIAAGLMGFERLLEELNKDFSLKRNGKIYKLLASWPVPVYLTTNYDDEIQNHLAQLGETYIPYSNSEEHLGHLVPELNGAIFKLHGDLRSEIGLILTKKHYAEISNAASWQYWRTKMTSIFQMNRVVILGHSLTDVNIKHVLEAAKIGAGVVQPICWIAADVPPESRREFLEKYRIRVISYDNQNGTHKNLIRLVENLNDFIPPRTKIGMPNELRPITKPSLGKSSGAPGFFVFNEIFENVELEEKRLEIIIAALQSVLRKLDSLEGFDIKTALTVAGWPNDLPIDDEFSEKIASRSIKDGIFFKKDKKFYVMEDADKISHENSKNFEHMQNRFVQSVKLRIQRQFPSFERREAEEIAIDIESSLVGYFKEGGLTLAITLFADDSKLKRSAVPSSILRFVNKASAQYDSLLKRQAFSAASIDIFVRPGSAEIQYLGRLSQGFFAFHSLGVFGEAANERIRHAKSTVWIVDSNSQIPALALAAPTSSLFRECFTKLKALGVRFCTTEKLFEECRAHLWFAQNLIKKYGENSPSVISAAKGQTPYYKSNLFLEGFIRWQAIGNPFDWTKYMHEIFGIYTPDENNIKKALEDLGIEIIAFQNWPGFSDTDYADCEEFTNKICDIYHIDAEPPGKVDSFQTIDPFKKSQPEGEAFIIVKRERDGDYYLLSDCGEGSPAWFISPTSVLNTIEDGMSITWRPEAFLRFASTLSFTSTKEQEDQAFEAILLGLAQSGLTLLNDEIIESVFKDEFDQATLSFDSEKARYEELLEKKYGKSQDKIFESIPPSQKIMAAIQFHKEMSLIESQRREKAEESRDEAEKRAKRAEVELKRLEKYRAKMLEKQEKNRKKTAKLKRSKRKKRKKKKK